MAISLFQNTYSENSKALLPAMWAPWHFGHPLVTPTWVTSPPILD